MAIVYFLCGMPAAGKTATAKRIELEKGAVRFTLDERMIAQYEFSIFDKQYGYLASVEKDRIWEEAKEILQQGGDVILDWSLWSRESRIKWPRKVLDEGHNYKLIYLDVPIEVLRQRLSRRNADDSVTAHFVPLEEMERFWPIFEPPSSEEGLNLEIISAEWS